MENIVEIANEYWNLWLLLMFIIVIAWSLWPTKERSAQMKHAANIPFNEDMPDTGKGELK